VCACVCDPGYEGPDCRESKVSDAKGCPTVNDQDQACSGHGTCLITGECDCWLGFYAAACASKATDFPFSCSGNGECNDQLGVCRCFENYRGATCELWIRCGSRATLRATSSGCERSSTQPQRRASSAALRAARVTR